jgi:hypothetical protein
MVGRWGSTSATSVPQSSDSSAAQVALVAPPHRQRRAPEPVAGQCPVDVVGQPLPHPAVPDVLGVPADRLVLGHEVGLAVRGADVPRRLAPVDERGAAPPAVGVGVRVGMATEQQAGRLEPVVDRAVGVAHRLALQPRHGVGEPPIGAHRVEGGQVGRPADLAVDLAERRGQVDDAGPLVGLDEVAGHHPPADPGGVGRTRRYVVEGPPIVKADQCGAGHHGVGCRALAEDLCHERCGHHRVADHGVVELRADGRTGVGQQGPGSGGPGDEGEAVE